MDSPFIVFDSNYEGRRHKLGQKRCKIGLSILMKEGAKFRTKITCQQDAKLVNKFPFKKLRIWARKGARLDSSLSFSLNTSLHLLTPLLSQLLCRYSFTVSR